MAHRGVAKWISSLRDSRVSRLAQPESERASRTSAGSGPRLSGFFATYDQGSCSWRTSQGSLFQESGPYSDPFPAWGSMRSGALYERAMPGRLTDGRVSSSSHHTPTVGEPLSGELWPTPDARVEGREVRRREPPQGQAGCGDCGATDPGIAGGALAVADGESRDERPGARRDEPHRRSTYPPGPGDAEGWRQWIADEGPQPGVCGGADGPPARVDRVRLLGNGVVPQQAALAFRILAGRLI
jgi:hypothetical protein